jgi:general secretion pathway protein H
MDGDCATPARGFTLVEVLVVVLVVGLLFGFAILAINPGSRDARLEKEATRLWRLLLLAAEESLLQARELGVRVAESGYAFYVLEEGEWKVVAGDRRLREREFPEFVRPDVEIEGLRIVLDESPGAAKPQIMMLSSGEMIPDFAIYLRDRETDRTYRLAPSEEMDVAMQLHLE